MFIDKLQLVHMGDIFFLVLPIFHICTVIGCYFLLKSVARILTTQKKYVARIDVHYYCVQSHVYF